MSSCKVGSPGWQAIAIVAKELIVVEIVAVETKTGVKN